MRGRPIREDDPAWHDISNELDQISDRISDDSTLGVAPPEIRSTDWLDALAEKWARRIKQLEKRYGGNAGMHNKGMIKAHKTDLRELRAGMGSASNG